MKKCKANKTQKKDKLRRNLQANKKKKNKSSKIKMNVRIEMEAKAEI